MPHVGVLTGPLRSAKKLAVAAHRHSLFLTACVGTCGDGATAKKLAVAAHCRSLFLAACVVARGNGATTDYLWTRHLGAVPTRNSASLMRSSRAIAASAAVVLS